MDHEVAEQPDRFVPVSEAIRDRTERARLVGAWSGTELLWLLTITLVAVALRFWRLEIWSVSASEVEMWRAATSGFGSGLSAPAHGLRWLFDAGVLPTHGEGWLRLPFLFFGMLAVPALAFVGDPLIGRRAALFAALLLALHPWHVDVCQTATGHGAALTLIVLALGSAEVAARTGRAVSWFLAVAGCAAAVAIHPLGWMTLAVVFSSRQFEEWHGAEPRDRVKLLAGFGLLIAAGVAAVVWLRPPGPGGSITGAAAALLGWIHAAGLLVVALAMLVPWTTPRRPRQRRLLAVAVVVPVAIALLLGVVAVEADRDLAVPALPPLLLLAARGAFDCWRSVRGALGGRGLGAAIPAALVGAALVLELSVGSMFHVLGLRGSRPDWRAARDHIIETAGRPRMRVLAAAGHDSLIYYLRPDHWRVVNGDPHPGIVVSRLDLSAPGLASYASAADAGEGALYLVLLPGELAAIERIAGARRALRSSFVLSAVVPSPGPDGPAPIRVYRLAR